MPRHPRYELPDGFAHVMARGNRLQPIFLDGLDRQRFLAVMERAVQTTGCKCHAFCLMTTHFHVLVEGERAAISELMWRVNGFYAQAFNRRHCLSGHLFERRFRAIAVVSDRHSLELSRYIVLNPVRARMCAAPEDWPWSSFGPTLGLTPAPAFLTTDFVLGYFGGQLSIARTRYASFVAAGRVQTGRVEPGRAPGPGPGARPD